MYLIVQLDATDPCLTHGNLNNPFRSTGYVARYGVDPMLCDQNLPTGWYRFVSEVGGKMPETKATMGQCETYAPIWLKTSHPSTADGIVDRTACINFNDLNNGCLPMGIKVKNCNDSFYVYRLVPTLGCPMAYCAGTCLIKCPPNYSKVNVYLSGADRRCPSSQVCKHNIDYKSRYSPPQRV